MPLKSKKPLPLMFLSVQRMLSYSIHYIILYYIIFFYLVQKKKKIYLLKEGMMNAKKNVLERTNYTEQCSLRDVAFRKCSEKISE